jgi:hypothetical protein
VAAKAIGKTQKRQALPLQMAMEGLVHLNAAGKHQIKN